MHWPLPRPDRPLWLAVCLGLLALAGPALAQSGPATTVGGVTVTAKPAPPPPPKNQSAYDRALNFVTSHGRPSKIGQLARWETPVCPVTIGLSAEQNGLVSYRVGQVANLAGLPPPRKRRCDANVEIVFTAEPQKLLDAVADKRNDYLGFHYASQRAALQKVTHPIQAWYLTATRGGISAGPGADAGYGVGGPELDVGLGSTPGGCLGSHFTECLRSEFVNVLIVVDGNRMDDFKIDQVADYVALLALSQARVEVVCDSLPSVLDIMGPPCGDRPVPEGLTKSDQVFLKGLYHADPSALLWLQRDQIADKLTEPPPPPNAKAPTISNAPP